MNTTYSTYTERVLIATPAILGYQLKYFSLGHCLILKGSNSRFINGVYNFITKDDIARRLGLDLGIIPEFVFAIIACSTSYDEFKDDITNGEFTKVLNDMVETIKTYDIQTIIDSIYAFVLYLNKGTEAPSFIPKNDESVEVSSSPVSNEENIMSTLMTDCGYTRNECLNLPLTETLSAYLLYAHKMDKIMLVSKEVYELTKKMKAK